MARLTLLDIAKRAGNDQAVGIVESMSQANALRSEERRVGKECR